VTRNRFMIIWCSGIIACWLMLAVGVIYLMLR